MHSAHRQSSMIVIASFYVLIYLLFAITPSIQADRHGSPPLSMTQQAQPEVFIMFVSCFLSLKLFSTLDSLTFYTYVYGSFIHCLESFMHGRTSKELLVFHFMLRTLLQFPDIILCSSIERIIAKDKSISKITPS